MARSIVLKRGDLSTAFTLRTRPDDDLPKGVRCGALDESDLTITGEAQSPDFELSQPGLYVTIGSTTNVYRSPGDAGKSWKRGTSSQTTTCLADIVRLSAPRGQRVSIVSAKRLTFPKVAPMTAAFRVVATLTIAGNRVRAYVDAIILQHGRDPVGRRLHVARTPGREGRRARPGGPRRGPDGQGEPSKGPDRLTEV